MNITVNKTTQPKAKPTSEQLNAAVFGSIFTDHMFMMDYNEAQGWHDARIVPYGPITLDPASNGLHYGQLIFEGMKAYKTGDGRVVMFRPDQNMARLNNSCKRMCIPEIDQEGMLKAIATLVELDSEWIPTQPGTSLYVRPFIFATQPLLAVHPSHQYTLMVILSPVASYYKEGLAPVSIYVENSYVRAVKGGTGFAKCAGNYAAALRSQVEAEEEGYSQVLWLDGVERKYIEEVGSMNVFFVIDGEVVTPALNGSILPGITRKSVIEVVKNMGLPMVEKNITIQELADAYKEGRVQEAFGAGTAAVISPIGALKWGDMVMKFSDGEIGEISQKLYDEITGIQTCKLEDKYGWVYTVKKA